MALYLQLPNALVKSADSGPEATEKDEILPPNRKDFWNQEIAGEGQYSLLYLPYLEDIIVHPFGSDLCLWHLDQKNKREYIRTIKNGISSFCVNNAKQLIAVAEYGLNPEILLHRFPLPKDKKEPMRIKTDAKIQIAKMEFSRDGNRLVAISGLPDYKISVYDTELCEKLPGISENLPDKNILKVAFNPKDHDIFALMTESTVFVYEIEQTCEFISGDLKKSYRLLCKTTSVPLECTDMLWDKTPNLVIADKKGKRVVVMEVGDEEIIERESKQFEEEPLALLLTQTQIIISFNDGNLHWFSYEDGGQQIMGETPMHEAQIEYGPLQYMIYNNPMTKIVGTTSKGVTVMVQYEAPCEDDEEMQPDIPEREGGKKDKGKDNFKLLPAKLGDFLTSKIICIKELPDSTQVLTISSDGAVCLWENTAMQQLAKFEINSTPICAETDPKGEVVYIGCSDGSLRIIDLSDRMILRLIKIIKLYTSEITKIKMGPDGLTLACSSQYEKNLFFINSLAESGFLVQAYYKMPENIISFDWMKTDPGTPAKIIAILKNSLMMIFSPPPETAKNLVMDYEKSPCSFNVIDNNMAHVLCAPSGDILVTGSDRKVKKYEVPDSMLSEIDMRKPASSPAEEFPGHGLGISCWAVSPDGKLLASGSKDGTYQIRMLTSLSQAKEGKSHGVHQGGVSAINFSPARNMLYIAGGDGSFLMLNMSKEPLPTAPKTPADIGEVLRGIEEVEDLPEVTLPLVTDLWKEEEKKQKEDEKEKLKDHIREELQKIKEGLRELLIKNEQMEEIEKLDREEFLIDKERKERMLKERDMECEKLRKQAAKENFRAEILRNRIKECTWDRMEVQSTGCKSLNSDQIMFNYPIRNQTSDELTLYNKLANIRRLEIKEISERRAEELLFDKTDLSLECEHYYVNRFPNRPSIQEEVQEKIMPSSIANFNFENRLLFLLEVEVDIDIKDIVDIYINIDIKNSININFNFNIEIDIDIKNSININIDIKDIININIDINIEIDIKDNVVIYIDINIKDNVVIYIDINIKNSININIDININIEIDIKDNVVIYININIKDSVDIDVKVCNILLFYFKVHPNIYLIFEKKNCYFFRKKILCQFIKRSQCKHIFAEIILDYQKFLRYSPECLMDIYESQSFFHDQQEYYTGISIVILPDYLQFPIILQHILFSSISTFYDGEQLFCLLHHYPMAHLNQVLEKNNPPKIQFFQSTPPYSVYRNISILFIIIISITNTIDFSSSPSKVANQGGGSPEKDKFKYKYRRPGLLARGGQKFSSDRDDQFGKEKKEEQQKEDTRLAISQAKKEVDYFRKNWKTLEGYELLYEPFELQSNSRKRMQIIFIKDIIRRMKKDFNKEFEDLCNYKSEQISMIKEKNLKIEELQKDLKEESTKFEINFDPREKPEHILTVTEEDITIPKYLTKEEKLKLEEQRRKEEERLKALQSDTLGRRGIMSMMGGVLEMKRELDELEKSLVRQPWMDLPENQMTEAQRQEFTKFRQMEEDLKERKLNQQKAWRQELNKAHTEIEDLCSKFDERMNKLMKKKLFMQLRVYEQELYIIRLNLSLFEEKLLHEEKTRTENDIQMMEEEKTKLPNITTQLDSNNNGSEEDKDYSEKQRMYDPGRKIRKEEDFWKEEIKTNFSHISGIDYQSLEDFIKRGREKIREIQEKNAKGSGKDRKEDSGNVFRRSPYVLIDRKILDEQENYNSRLDCVFPQLNEDNFKILVGIRRRYVDSARTQLETENEKEVERKYVQDIAKKKKDLEETVKKSEDELVNIKNNILQNEKNIELIIRIKQGQVEISLIEIAPKLETAILINRQIIQSYNMQIIQNANSLLEQLTKISKSEKKRRENEWKYQLLEKEIDYLQACTLTVKQERIGRHPQFTKKDEIPRLESEKIAILNKQISRLQENANKRIKNINSKIMALQKQIEDKKKENDQLEQEARRLQDSLKQRIEILDLSSGGGGEEVKLETQNKMKIIASKRRLNDLLIQQEEEFMMLSEELNRIREKTFPSFANVQAKYEYPDEKPES